MAIDDVQAIVLAAGQGSRMSELVKSKAKCLLPIANQPMIYYSFYALKVAKFSAALVCILDQQDIKDAISKAAELCQIKIEFFCLPHDQDLGTVETLLLLHESKKIKNDFMVISCDTFTNFSLINFINLFRVHNPTLAVCISSSYLGIDANTPGRKEKPELEKDLIGIDSRNGNRLVYLQSELDVDEEAPLKVSMLTRCPNFDLRNNYFDSHIYIIKRWVLEFLSQKKQFKSIKGDLLPYLVQQQFRNTKNSQSDKNKEDLLENYIEGDELTDCLTLLDNVYLDSPSEQINNALDYPKSKVKCFAYVPNEGICIRANTITGYFEANKRHKAVFPDVKIDSRMENSNAESPKAIISSDCVISPFVSIGDCTTVKKSFIAEKCVIKDKVKISNSVIMDDVTIGKNCIITGSIICNHVVIEDDVEIKDCIIIADHTISEGKYSHEVLPSLSTTDNDEYDF